MRDIIENPIFGVLISFIAYEFGSYLNKKTKSVYFNPLLISQFLIIFILVVFDISYNDYNIGGKVISFFLIPATIVLAVPLFKQINLLKTNSIPIIGGIIVGSISGIISVIVLAKLFNLNEIIMKSLIPKSITSPIGMEVSEQIGGNPAITVPVIILTGIIGSVIVPYICKIFKIYDKIAVGIALGTSSHAVGTAKAIEMGELEGAMSGLAIGIAGIVTVFAAPLIIRLFEFVQVL
ncbi:MAG: hypothetical protein K0Q49_1345 [Haloplasmataceae bacterium]|jgi:predicted murein hydrolase (TIGR00659 family)|nr:hypothetical protein [Haloplasmataceae bacterium]